MKKLLKSLACFAAAALVGASAFANYDWYDTSIGIGGIKSNFQDWSRGNGAPDTDLGALTSLTLSSVEMNIWDDDNDRGGVNMFFRLYGDNGQIGGDVDVWLGGAERIEGSVHDFSVSYTGPFDLANAFGVTLEDGKTYYLNMWAKSYGDAGDHWYSGDGDNYHTKFVYCATPKTYTLVESADDLVVGADYLVVSTVDGAYSAMKNEVIGSTGIGCLGLADDAISGNTIAAASDAIVWQIVSGTALGQRELYNAAANVFAADSDDLAGRAQLLADGTDALAQWTIDTSALPAVKFYSVSYPDRCLQRDNFAANERFAAYDRAHVAPCLYRDNSTVVQTVTFDPNGGTYLPEKQVMKYAFGREYWGIWAPTWDGHKFLGWFDEDGNRVKNGMEVAGPAEMTVYARWADCQTVYFNANGGTHETASVVCAVTYTGFTMPTWDDNHKFLGWFDEEGNRVKGGMPVTGGAEKTVYAHWADYQTVYFNANGGTHEPASVRCVVTYSGFTMPTWDDEHRFLGWFDEDGKRVKAGMEVTGGAEKTVYAHWATYQTVYFDANGGTHEPASVRCIVTYTGFTMPTWDENHKFLGWFDAEGNRVKGGMEVTGGAEKTVYAHWATYQTVYFDANGGTHEPASVRCVVTYSGFTMPTWEGHEFLGWWDAKVGGTRLMNGTPVTGGDEKTVFAHWKELDAAPASRSAFVARGTTTKQDVLNLDFTGVSGTTYSSWSDKTGTSGAVYAGQSAGGNSSIQLRSNNNNSGIVTTTSSGTVAKVTIDWNSNTSNGNKVDVYGKDSAYSAPTDLYSSTTQGTLLGSITNGTSTELTIANGPKFIGLRSNKGAVYLNSVTIDWTITTPDDPPSSEPTVSLAASAEEVYVGETVTIEATAANFSGDVTWTWYVDNDEAQETTSTFALDTSSPGTYVVTAWAYDEDNNDAEASVTITVKPQTVTLNASATSVEVGETVTITATPVGFSGAVDWVWTVNDVEVSTATTATFALDTTEPGSYEVEAMASYGAVQLAVSDPVTITVSEHVEVTADVLTNDDVGSTSSNYGTWTATKASGAEYAGQSAGGSSTNPCIQLRSNNNNSGIVMTKGSGRDVSSVTIEWNAQSGADRVVDVYGSATAYSSPSDLYGNEAGTFLGSVTNGADEVTVDVAGAGAFPFVGIRSHSGALYLTSVTIAFAAATPTVTLEATATTVEVGETVTITATAANFSGAVTWEWAADEGSWNGNTFTLTPSAARDYEVIAEATYGTQRAENSVTITATPVTTKYAITIDPTIEHGSISTDPVGPVAANTPVTVNDNPDPGYVLGTIKVNGSDIPGNTFNMPAEPVTVSATFVAVPTYTLVENAADLVVGADYLIVASGEGYTNAMKGELTTTSTKRLSVENVTIGANGKIATADESIVWQLKGGVAAGQRVFYNADAGKYAAAPSSSTSAARLLEDGTDEAAQWTIDTSDMTAVMIQSAKYDTRYLQRNHEAGNRYFAAYTGEQAPRFYRADSTEVQTVTFDANGGTYPEEKQVMKYAFGREYWGIWAPTWENHKFLGWFDAEGNRVKNGMEVAGDAEMTVYAHWADYQTVYFDANGGTHEPASVVCAVTYTGFTMPTWDDEHRFLGWFDEEGNRVKGGMEVTGGAEKTVYAHWATYQTVYFDANGGTHEPASVRCIVTYTGFTMPTWDDEHRFLGWFDEEGNRVKGGMEVTGGAEKTVYAHWATYQTVYFDANGGTHEPSSVRCIVTYTGFTMPTWDENHKFLGWFDAEGNRVKGGMEVTGGAEKTVYAHWATYQTVYFNANGGTHEKESVRCVVTYSGFTMPTWDGHEFLGWWDDPTGGTRLMNGTPVTGGDEKTVYAHWRESALSISGFGMKAAASNTRDTRNDNEQVSVLRFDAIADFVYEVQWAASLDGEWTALKRWTAEENGEAEVSVSLPAGASGGFFRLAVFEKE